MSRRVVWVVVAIACAVAIAVVWLRWPTITKVVSSRTAPASAPLPPRAADTDAPPASAVAAPAPTVGVPPDVWLPSNDVRDFSDAAAAGDADAMLRVGRALRACVEYLADPDGAKLREEHERAIAGLRERNLPSEAPAFANTNDRFARRFAMRADCLSIGAERIVAGLAFIERAARAGHVKAKVEFARGAFSEFPDGGALLANLDEVARRRDLARHWVMQALEAGEPGAVDVLVDAYYGDSPLFPRDFRQGAPYSMAQEMIRTRRVDPAAFRRLYEQGPNRESYAWGDENAWVRDDAAWQAALERARAIVDRIPPDPPRKPLRPPPPG